MKKTDLSDLGPLFAPKEEENSAPALTVSQLNGRIKQVLNSSFRAGVWVYGEVYRYDLDIAKAASRQYGQVYFELVEQDPVTKERKAAISAVMWGDDRAKVYEKMSAAMSGLVIKDGLQIKAKCFVDFYPPQGKIQVRISDIEPEYTVGKMAVDKKLLLEKLKASGLLDRNKQVEIPRVPLNVGLITSAGSAAYNDFVDELRKSGYGFGIFLCDARMQGPELESEVRAAIAAFDRQPVDVLAIVRGGGSASDLMGFDKEGVAVAIANSRKPVLTGIGHQIDRTVADEVANRSFKTPTAAAQFIVETVRAFEEEAENAFELILSGTDAFLAGQSDRLKNLSKEVKSQSLLFTQKLESSISRVDERLRWVTKKFFDDSYGRLDEWERLVNSKKPQNILKMGFSLVYGDGDKIIKSVKNISVGAKMTVELRDGRLGGTVTSKERN